MPLRLSFCVRLEHDIKLTRGVAEHNKGKTELGLYFVVVTPQLLRKCIWLSSTMCFSKPTWEPVSHAVYEPLGIVWITVYGSWVILQDWEKIFYFLSFLNIRQYLLTCYLWQLVGEAATLGDCFTSKAKGMTPRQAVFWRFVAIPPLFAQWRRSLPWRHHVGYIQGNWLS